MKHPHLAAALASTFLTLAACESSLSPPARPEPSTTPLDDAAAAEHYARALELDAAGRPAEAGAEVALALAAGAGRDAALLAARLAILGGDLDGAAEQLGRLLAADPRDVAARYNLGLVAHRRGKYNQARSEYLAALKLDPTHAAARYNLAVLTADAGAREEARHHTRKFVELAPNDPRTRTLLARVGLPEGAGAPAN